MNQYQDMCERIIAALTDVPRLLLHSCCAPCSSAVIAYLSQHFRLTVYFYNPNIDTDEEYERRRAEQIRFITEFPATHPVDYLCEPHRSEVFLTLTKGYEDAPERGARCTLCFTERLQKTAQTAASLQYPFFCTTLTLSPLKDAALINAIGTALESDTVRFLPSDFKKKDGYQKSIVLSKEYGLYRQNYCGCRFSKK